MKNYYCWAEGGPPAQLTERLESEFKSSLRTKPAAAAVHNHVAHLGAPATTQGVSPRELGPPAATCTKRLVLSHHAAKGRHRKCSVEKEAGCFGNDVWLTQTKGNQHGVGLCTFGDGNVKYLSNISQVTQRSLPPYPRGHIPGAPGDARNHGRD